MSLGVRERSQCPLCSPYPAELQSQLQLWHHLAFPEGGTVERCPILTGRTEPRDAEPSTEEERKAKAQEGRRRKRQECVIKHNKPEGQ